MRRARYFPMVVVGLATIVSQTTMLQQCRGQYYVPDGVQLEPYTPPKNGRIVDESVQQAGFYNSRPRPNTTMPGMSGPESSSTNRGGALFRGQKLKMPTLPFGRQTSNRAAVRVPQSSTPMPNPAQSSAARSQLRGPAALQSAAQPMPQRMPAGTPAAANANVKAARATSGRPPQPMQQQTVPHIAAMPQLLQPAPPKTIPNSSSVPPWTKKPSTAPSAKPAPAAAVKPAAPLSAADRLVADAHGLSTRAQSAEDYTQVIETCRRAQASDASPAAAQFAKNLVAWSLNRRGQLKAEAGFEKESILDFDDAIRNDPSCWRAVHNRGVLLAQAGQFEKAFDDFSHTIQLNPLFAKAYSNRAALFMVANNLDSALADYKQAITLDANLAVAHRGCGRVCQLIGNVDDAVGHYDAAVQLAPGDAYAAACRADLLTDVGRYSEAVAEYERAIQIDPKSSQAQGGSAWLLATCPDSSIRNAGRAIERARTVIEEGGDRDAVNYDTLAAAYASAGDYEAAMNSVRTAIELAPADERDAYKDRLILYQKAKPYRISPVERMAQQVSYETSSGVEGVAR
jgi:tetratricopeptide (TPR) repeat protein